MKRLFALALATLMVLSLVACGGGGGSTTSGAASSGTTSTPVGTSSSVTTPDPAKEYKKEFVIAVSTAIKGWDPTRDNTAAFVWCYNLVWDSLMFQDLDTGEYLPRLATEWEVSEGNTVVTLKLREDAYFSNGEQFDSDDVLFTMERMKAFPDKTIPKMFADVEKVEAINRFTVKYTLSSPNPDFLLTLAQPYNVMYNRDAFKKDPATGEYDWEWPEINVSRIEGSANGHLIGTGLYVLEDYVENDYTSVAKRTDGKYWGEDNPTERFVFRSIPEAAARLLALEAGEVDYVYNVSADDIPYVKDNPDLTFVTGERTGIHYMTFNCSKEGIWGDQNFRQAFSKALNRDELVIAQYAGIGSPATSNYSSLQFGYVSQDQVYGYDPEGAKELLAKTDYKGETITIVTVAAYKNLALAMCDQLKKVGINAALREETGSTIWTVLKNEEQDAHIYNINMNTNGDDLRRFLDSAGGIPGIDVNPIKEKLWGMFNEALSAPTNEKRLEIYAEIQKLMAEDCYILPLIVPGGMDAQSANVEGMYWRANQVLDFRAARAVVD